MNGVSRLAGWSNRASISASPGTSTVSFEPVFSGRGGPPLLRMLEHAARHLWVDLPLLQKYLGRLGAECALHGLR